MLTHYVESAATEQADTAPFRLPIDRCFIQRGFGTVVTGTARGRDLNDGSAGRLSMLLLPAAEAAAMNQQGFAVGKSITRQNESFVLENGTVAQLSDGAKRSIFVEIETKSV